jgi:hypothetical protein
MLKDQQKTPQNTARIARAVVNALIPVRHSIFRRREYRSPQRPFGPGSAIGLHGGPHGNQLFHVIPKTPEQLLVRSSFEGVHVAKCGSYEPEIVGSCYATAEVHGELRRRGRQAHLQAGHQSRLSFGEVEPRMKQLCNPV